LNNLRYFFELARAAAEIGPALLPGLTFLALAGLVLAVLSAAANTGNLLRRRSLWLLVPFAIPVLILIYGVVFVYHGPVWSAPAWRGGIVDGLIWSHVIVAALLFWKLRGLRLVVLGLSVFQWWMSLCAGFMAGMSVTNVWL
jgi:hypothetical protein